MCYCVFALTGLGLHFKLIFCWILLLEIDMVMIITIVLIVLFISHYNLCVEILNLIIIIIEKNNVELLM